MCNESHHNAIYVINVTKQKEYITDVTKMSLDK